MGNRKRNLHLHVMVTAEELEQIHARMAEAGISNTGAYVRKMALNGYILHVDLAPVKELVSLQQLCGALKKLFKFPFLILSRFAACSCCKSLPSSPISQSEA